MFRHCTARHGGGLDAEVFVGERRVLITMKTGGFVLDNVTYRRSSKKKRSFIPVSGNGRFR